MTKILQTFSIHQESYMKRESDVSVAKHSDANLQGLFGEYQFSLHLIDTTCLLGDYCSNSSFHSRIFKKGRIFFHLHAIIFDEEIVIK